MVELYKPPYESDEPIHRGYIPDAERTYWVMKKQKEKEERRVEFVNGLNFIKDKCLGKYKQ
jgi:hypothetical protein